MLDTGCQIPDTGYQIRDANLRLVNQIPDAGLMMVLYGELIDILSCYANFTECRDWVGFRDLLQTVYRPFTVKEGNA